ncbi:MAG: YtxH domain-containing protein [Williamsia sp.]|nr:YtxH domain-containing protein [Williamsia sp.]
MANSTSFWIGLAVGAAASAALAIFLQSDQGQDVVDDIKDAAEKAQDELKKAYSSFEDKLDHYLHKSKEVSDDIEKKAYKLKKSVS